MIRALSTQREITINHLVGRPQIALHRGTLDRRTIVVLIECHPQRILEFRIAALSEGPRVPQETKNEGYNGSILRAPLPVSTSPGTERAELELERNELKADDKVENKELAAIYVARGLEPALTRTHL